MSVTPFTNQFGFDDAAYREHLDRMVNSGVGVYLASPGSGEGHALSDEELSTAYKIGVEICKGRVPVYANVPEARNADQLIARARLAVEAGVDVVQIYTVDAGHSMRPTEAEQEAFYRKALDQLDHPIGLSVNILAGGYITPIRLLERLCSSYSNIQFINVLQPPTSYLAELMESVGHRVEYYTGAEMLVEGLTLGTRGCMTGHANVVPYLVRSIGSHFVAGRMEETGRSLSSLFRLNRAVERFALDADAATSWSARWIKAAMKVLSLPGHSDGRMRPPYLTPEKEKITALAKVLRDIDLERIENEAKAALTR